MTQNNKLSIIIPCYNGEKYLKECLDSVINQTFRDTEIICVNDGSTDGSLAILEEYAKLDDRIKIVNKENGGLAAARNAGMNAATGEYFAFVDCDDILELNAYESAMKHIEKADIVCFGIKLFGEGNLAQRNRDNNYYKVRYKGKKALTPKIILKTDVSACNKIFKKSIIDENQIKFPDGLNYEDAEFYCKYISCSKTAYYLNERFYNYRRTGDSIMSTTFSGTPKAIHHLCVVNNIFEFWLKNNYLFKNERMFVKIFLRYFNSAYNFSTKEMRPKVLLLASDYAVKFSENLKFKSNFIKYLARNKYGNIYIPDLKFYQKIFNIVTVYDLVDKCDKKYIYLFGLKLKRQNKYLEVIRRLNNIEDEVDKIVKMLGEINK